MFLKSHAEALLLCFLYVQLSKCLSNKLYSPVRITAHSKERLSEEASVFLFFPPRNCLVFQSILLSALVFLQID